MVGRAGGMRLKRLVSFTELTASLDVTAFNDAEEECHHQSIDVPATAESRPESTGTLGR